MTRPSIPTKSFGVVLEVRGQMSIHQDEPGVTSVVHDSTAKKPNVFSWLAAHSDDVELYAGDFVAVDKVGVYASSNTLRGLIRGLSGMAENVVIFHVPVTDDADLELGLTPRVDSDAPAIEQYFYANFLGILVRAYKRGLEPPSEALLRLTVAALGTLEECGSLPTVGSADQALLDDVEMLLERIEQREDGEFLKLARDKLWKCIEDMSCLTNKREDTREGTITVPPDSNGIVTDPIEDSPPPPAKQLIARNHNGGKR